MHTINPIETENTTNLLTMNNSYWFAVYTRSRHEKYVDAFLQERHISTFLPLVRVLSRRRDRRKLIDIPLFPGYLFVNISGDYLYKVRETKGVVGIVGRDYLTPTPVKSEQIDNLKILLSSDVKIDPYKYLQNGRRVRVIAGPLSGIEGILLRRKKNYKVVVSIDLLQKSATAEVSVADIESID